VVNTRFVMRLGQAMLVLVLGLSAHTAQGRACFDCDECASGSCGTRVCEDCPVAWWGSCYAGTEGCGHYGCTPVSLCCLTGLQICETLCDCPPCP
jgi:hypothetical protein